MNDEPTSTNDLGPQDGPRVVRMMYRVNWLATKGNTTPEMGKNGAEAETLSRRLLGPEFSILLCRTNHGGWLPLSQDGEEEAALTSVEGWEKYWEILPQLPEGGQWAKSLYLGA